MSRNVRLQELLVGIEGLALLRNLYDGTDQDAQQRIAEVRHLLDDERLAAGEPITEATARDGYGAWSAGYDEPGNPVVALEQREVWAIVDALPPGTALDGACGTGRHSKHLVGLGHQVTGVDLTPEMLAQARAAVPEATFTEADLLAIPAADGQFALAVCGLALAHIADLPAAVAELSRVLGPGGHLVVSVLHPFQALLGWHAPFTDEGGERHFVREHPHTHADYLAAFRVAGLHLVGCAEPVMGPVEVAAKRRATRHIPEATLAAYLGLPAVLVWHLTKPQPDRRDR
jgi:SAM-dependent methyltransferase